MSSTGARQRIPSEAVRPPLCSTAVLAEGGTSAGVLFAATENDEVQALDAVTGRQLWRRRLINRFPTTPSALGRRTAWTTASLL